MTTIVAIDGPAGSGKSSVSKAAARRLGFGYLDTGAAYRALSWAVLTGRVVEPSRESFEGFDYEISLDPNDFWVHSFGVDVTEEIRKPQIAENVSNVAGIPSVRAWMKELSRTVALSAQYPGVVVEGRDITTVVFPDARVRILLTASEEVRLQRRAGELSAEALATLRQQVLDRDAKDSKVVDFLTAAPGVTLLDTSNLDFEQSIQAVVDLVERSVK